MCQPKEVEAIGVREADDNSEFGLLIQESRSLMEGLLASLSHVARGGGGGGGGAAGNAVADAIAKLPNSHTQLSN